MSIKRLIQIDLAIDKDLGNSSNWVQIMSQIAFKLISIKLSHTSGKSIDHVMPLIQDYQNLVGVLQIKKASSKAQVLKCQAILDLSIMIGSHLCKDLAIDSGSLKEYDQQAFERQSSDFINNLKETFKNQCHTQTSDLLSISVFKSRVSQIISLLSGLTSSTSNETQLSKSIHHQITQLLFDTLKNLISTFTELIFSLITQQDHILSNPVFSPSQDPIVKDIREEVYQVYYNHTNIRDAQVAKQREQIIEHMSAVIQARAQVKQWFIENQESFGVQFREYVEFAKNTYQVIYLKLQEISKEGGFNQGCMALMASGYIEEGASGSYAIEQMLIEKVGKELGSKALQVKECGYSKPYRVLKNEYDKDYVFMASRIIGQHSIQPASHGLVQKLRECFFNTIKETLSSSKDDLLKEWLERVPHTDLKFIQH
ncbi:hypothetical protein FGO68_gene13148 [Halteria grandinella]|uniref:Uncharacterized protein n=1 Tax=Halteria grandinella TaxID=5974 RepID=A0A8J8NSM9_HALGN|nr:hypothetical protein FGO68_gene13148 [Halteria grandinella]